METLNRKPKRCKSSKKAWEREHEHGRRESCKLIVDCVLNSVSFSGFGRKTEYLTRETRSEYFRKEGKRSVKRALHLDNCTARKDLNGKGQLQTEFFILKRMKNEEVKQKNNWSQDEKRRKNQANKSAGWMPRHHTPKKDVASCEKPRGAASRQRTVDIRMGKPGGSNVPSSLDESIV